MKQTEQKTQQQTQQHEKTKIWAKRLLKQIISDIYNKKIVHKTKKEFFKLKRDNWIKDHISFELFKERVEYKFTIPLKKPELEPVTTEKKISLNKKRKNKEIENIRMTIFENEFLNNKEDNKYNSIYNIQTTNRKNIYF